MRALLFSALWALAALPACDRPPPAAPSIAPEAPEQVAAGVEVPILPPQMLGTFVPAGPDQAGRVVIVSDTMLAAIECADCGVPQYLPVQSVVCEDGSRCHVITPGCEGELAVTGDASLRIELRPTAGTEASCAAYNGVLVKGEIVGSRGEVVAASDAPRGQVLIGEVRSPRGVDLEAARQLVDANVDQLDECYRIALDRRPELAGEITIEVVHGARGSERAPAQVREGSFEDPGLVACIEGAFGGWEYPVADDGLPAPVYYQLAFVPR